MLNFEFRSRFVDIGGCAQDRGALKTTPGRHQRALGGGVSLLGTLGAILEQCLRQSDFGSIF